MMRPYQNALHVAAAICLVAAVIHGLWYRYLPSYPALQSLSEMQLGVMLLMNAAIALCLLVMGLATLYVARCKTLSLRHVQVFSLFLIGFWAGRFLLEIAMPLQIPLLFIDNPGTIAKIIMLTPIIILGLPFWLSAKRRQA